METYVLYYCHGNLCTILLSWKPMYYTIVIKTYVLYYSHDIKQETAMYVKLKSIIFNLNNFEANCKIFMPCGM